MDEATRRRLQSRAASKKKGGASRPKASSLRKEAAPSVDELTAAERRRQRKAVEAEAVREVHLQVTGKRQIEGALDVTPLPKRPRGPSDEAILIPGDEDEEGSEPVNIACPRKVVPAVNCFIDGAQMELSELSELPTKSLREQAGRAFRLQAAVCVTTWSCEFVL